MAVPRGWGTQTRFAGARRAPAEAKRAFRKAAHARAGSLCVTSTAVHLMGCAVHLMGCAGPSVGRGPGTAQAKGLAALRAPAPLEQEA